MPIATPGVTLTATLTNDSGVGIPGKIVCTLNNFGGVPPRIIGSNVIANLVTTAQANSSGVLSVLLYGNYQITIPGTYYEIAVYGVDAAGNARNGPDSVANYLFTAGGTFDLSSLIPIGVVIPSVSPSAPSGAARFTALGTPLVAGDFILTGWGAGATITAIHGSDMAHRFTITAGTAPSISPTVQLTFHDGPWVVAPIMQTQITDGTGAVSDLKTARTSSTYTLTYEGLPVVAKTYIIDVICIGVLN